MEREYTREMQKRFLVVGLTAFVRCGGSSPPPPTDPTALLATLEDLTRFESKRVGTEGGRQAVEYLKTRFENAGLKDIHLESFAFPQHVVDAKSIALTIAGQPLSPAVDAFEGSGAGHADADVIYVGTAKPDELANIDLTGKIALLE